MLYIQVRLFLAELLSFHQLFRLLGELSLFLEEAHVEMLKSLPRFPLEISGTILSYHIIPILRLYRRKVLDHWEGLTYVENGLNVAISVHGESISNTLHVAINLLNNPIDVLLLSCKIVEGLRDFTDVYQVFISRIILVLEIFVVLLELVFAELK
jgi:hypothetical protein